MRRIGIEERRARLVERQRLTPSVRAASALEAARAVVALHSTEPATVFLSVLARTEGLAPEDVEDEIYDRRTLVRMHGMRRTLFVAPLDLVPAIQAACTTDVALRERRRLEKLVAASGVSTQPAAWVGRGLAAALEELARRGEAFTSDLANAVPMLGKRLRIGAGTRFEATQSAASRVLPLLGMEGRAIRGRPRGNWSTGQYRWALAERWLGHELAAMDAAAARAELVRRWLAAFGPGTEVDLRWWTGWTARDVRGALAVVPHEAVDLDGATGYVLAGDGDPVEREEVEPGAALLPTLDPTTMGWKARGWYLGPHEHVLFDRNGNAGPTVWWDGRVVGGWSRHPSGEVVYRLLEDVGRDATAAVEREVERIADWIGSVRFRPTFLPPFQRELAAS